MFKDVIVPQIGVNGPLPIVELLVREGQVIMAGETLLVLEADKATLDVPSDHAGRIVTLRVAQGDQISAGDVILQLEIDDAQAADFAQEQKPITAEPSLPAPEALALASVARSEPHGGAVVTRAGLYASPWVRKLAFRLGVDLSSVTGSGRNGRITPEDVEAHVKARLQAPAPQSAGQGLDLLPWPAISPETFGPVERLPLSRIGKLSGPALQRNAVLIPHVTNFDEADLTELDALRKDINAAQARKDSILPYIAKACAAALRQHPKFNAVLDGGDLILRRYINIGIAADTPEGLVVPVLRDVDQKSVRELSDEMASLAADARAGRLKPSAMQGAGFTISSLGGIGGTGFTPIINAPEVAILGLARAQIKPVWDGKAFGPRLVQPMALSWDHRASDGVAAARFLRTIADYLADFRRILI